MAFCGVVASCLKNAVLIHTHRISFTYAKVVIHGLGYFLRRWNVFWSRSDLSDACAGSTRFSLDRCTRCLDLSSLAIYCQRNTAVCKGNLLRFPFRRSSLDAFCLLCHWTIPSFLLFTLIIAGFFPKINWHAIQSLQRNFVKNAEIVQIDILGFTNGIFCAIMNILLWENIPSRG